MCRHAMPETCNPRLGAVFPPLVSFVGHRHKLQCDLKTRRHVQAYQSVVVEWTQHKRHGKEH